MATTVPLAHALGIQRLVTELRVALITYGSHLTDCPVAPAKWDPAHATQCVCGLAEAILGPPRR